MKKDKPIVEYDPYGHSGNIYWILGQVSEIMRKQRRIIAFNDLRDRVFEAQSYDEALKIIGEEVTLVRKRKENHS
ncbi:MAG: hypothetical protein IJV91_09670 [Kiritimatiellae bacterium]|nr:hypothetical protein [Kiritimatiellia bacterium]